MNIHSFCKYKLLLKLKYSIFAFYTFYEFKKQNGASISSK